MTFPDIKKGDFVRVGSKWCRVSETDVIHAEDFHSVDILIVAIDYHNGMKIVHRSVNGDKCVKITRQVFIAHERARGNTAWQLW